MTRLLISIAVVCCFFIPAVAFGGNDAPKLYLELWKYTDIPDPLPTEVCVHLTKPVGGIHCYDTKVRYDYALVGVHIGNLNQPICSVTGPSCATFGGYLGLPFGVLVTGEAISFMSATACPGFLKGPSNAGEPAAILISSTALCHDWQDHIGYLTYFNPNNLTGTTFLGVVANADLGYYKVVNCTNLYDENTTIGAGAQWGGTQSITCPSTPVAETTWGSIKSLFR